MKLSEPVTAITDYILALELILLGALLLIHHGDPVAVKLWAASFFLMSLGAVAGGTFHAGRFSFASSILARLWKWTGIGIALSFALLLASAAMTVGGLFRYGLFAISVIVAFLIPAGFAAPDSEPGWKKSIGIMGLLFLALSALLFFHLRKNGSTAGNWILFASLITSIAIGIQQSKIAIHRHFNHNDLFHLLMMVAYYFLYRAGILLKDWAPSS